MNQWRYLNILRYPLRFILSINIFILSSNIFHLRRLQLGLFAELTKRNQFGNCILDLQKLGPALFHPNEWYFDWLRRELKCIEKVHISAAPILFKSDTGIKNENNLDGEASLLADPPQWNSITRQNFPICNRRPINAVHYEPILHVWKYFAFKILQKYVAICKISF